MLCFVVVAKGGPKIKEGVETHLPEDARTTHRTVQQRPIKDGFPALRRPGMAMMPGRQPHVLSGADYGWISRHVTPNGKQTTNTELTGKYEISLYWVSR